MATTTTMMMSSFSAVEIRKPAPTRPLFTEYDGCHITDETLFGQYFYCAFFLACCPYHHQIGPSRNRLKGQRNGNALVIDLERAEARASTTFDLTMPAEDGDLSHNGPLHKGQPSRALGSNDIHVNKFIDKIRYNCNTRQGS